ncbi:MAG: D-3-phosphoglycerate dehydrogenase [uncultured Thermomicrobiales bacterium]|uniref:D-3-phosphoglycerate dehydrogenase n=1 Tax=uncultured Thermomicrobiales bacterium TaxID=1645740 RepID=A0A6J4UK33_9BACT|nr:MAG: D-3-phosphoglycerate dehydrogenase [uncultured Thermomicrobiales bacterium]
MATPTWRVLIGSRSFGKASPEPVARLEAAGCEVVPNTIGRAYRAAELRDLLVGVDAIVTGTDELTAEVIAGADKLRTIAKHGVGIETIDLAAARARGIVVSATPGAISDSVADLTLALLLAVARRIVPAHASVVAGGWGNFVGTELRGRTLGIVGLGRIGQGVCLRAQAFGMTVVAHDPYPNEAFAAAHGVAFLPLPELLANSDAVSLHAGISGLERPLLGAAEITTMRRGAFLVNTARGNLVDEAALAVALRDGRLGGAGLDVFAAEPPLGSPLLDPGLENVVLAPHIAGQTTDGLVRMGEMTAENCLLALRGEPPLYRVP